MKLSDLPIGKIATIRDLNADESVSQRLMAMGLLPSAQVSVLRIAPFGDPITVDCLGNEISLRKADAALLDVELS